MNSVNKLIESIPWAELEHAYGIATDAPRELKNLLSEDELLNSNAYYDWLLSAVFHQITLYSATPFTIVVVLEILKTEDLSNKIIDDTPTEELLLDWLLLCSKSARHDQAVVDAITSGRAVYNEYLSNSNTTLVEKARAILDSKNLSQKR